MKACAYCGRENPDEAAQCCECGSGDFKTKTAPPILTGAEAKQEYISSFIRKHYPLRLLIAICVWLIVSGISIYVAWQQANHSITWWRQGETRRALEAMGKAAIAYQQEYKVAPHTFEQLLTMTSAVPELEYRAFAGSTDGWQHPFIFTNEGTNCLIISYGRDGMPGGKGIDYDLTSENPHPKESSPTFAQFFLNKECQGMIVSAFIGGGLAGLLSLLTVRVPNLNKGGIAILVLSLLATLIGTFFITSIITVLHVPSGH